MHLHEQINMYVNRGPDVRGPGRGCWVGALYGVGTVGYCVRCGCTRGAAWYCCTELGSVFCLI